MAENQEEGNLLTATESLVEWVSQMVEKYGLSESTIMDLFRIQLMWVEQSEQRQAAMNQPSGQDLVDAIGEEQRARANEVIAADE